MERFGTTMRALISVLVVGALSTTGLAQRIDTGEGPFLQGITTTSATLIYAPFVSNTVAEPGRFDTTFVISNPLSFPPGMTSPFLVAGGNLEGVIELYFFDFDGTMIYFDSTMDPNVGIGLSAQGTLGPGKSWIFLLQDILAVTHNDRNKTFNGQVYIVGRGLDGLAGAVSVVNFGNGFTQTLIMTPALGQGPTPMPGLPVRFP